jgi:hypothetical protein
MILRRVVFFGRVESIPHKFKYQVVTGQVKYDHHHSTLARGYVKAICMAHRHVIQQFPIQLCFTVFVEAVGDMQFGDAFVR